MKINEKLRLQPAFMSHRNTFLSHFVVYIVNIKIPKHKMPVLKSPHLILIYLSKNLAWTLLESDGKKSCSGRQNAAF